MTSDPSPDSAAGSPPPLPVRPAGATRIRVAPASTNAVLGGPASAGQVVPEAAGVAPYIPSAAAPVRSNSKVLLTALSAALLLGAIVLALVVLPNASGSCSQCGQVQEFEDQGHTHIGVATPHPTYNSDPPTSGWHREEFPPDWANRVLFNPPLADEVSVHLMEHGYLIAWYSCPPGPDCDKVRDGLVAAGKSLAGSPGRHLFVMQRDHLPNHATVALGAWRHLELLSGFDGTAVQDFIRHYSAAVQENAPAPTPSLKP